MKLFLSTRNYYKAMGIRPSDRSHSLNWRSGFILLLVFGFFISVAGPLSYKSISIIEYTYIFYDTATVFACWINGLIGALKATSIFIFIENTEKVIEKCELRNLNANKIEPIVTSVFFHPPGARDANSKAAYAKLNEKIEFTSKLIHLLFTRIAVTIVQLPVLIITLFNYYINDLKEDSYLLAFPMMLFRMFFIRLLYF